MKKLLLITAMFMAMNTWSAGYSVCNGTLSEVERCGKRLMNMGFEPTGSITPYLVRGNVYKYIQAFYM